MMRKNIVEVEISYMLIADCKEVRNKKKFKHDNAEIQKSPVINDGNIDSDTQGNKQSIELNFSTSVCENLIIIG